MVYTKQLGMSRLHEQKKGVEKNNKVMNDEIKQNMLGLHKNPWKEPSDLLDRKEDLGFDLFEG